MVGVAALSIMLDGIPESISQAAVNTPTRPIVDPKNPHIHSLLAEDLPG
jgi:hypothetical protein